MTKRTNYVFGAALAGCAISGVPGLLHKANAATAAAFTFESSFASVFGGTLTSGSTSAGGADGPYLAESGTGSAYGVHASSGAVYSVPAGNGSAHSLSSTTWAVGDYYQFNVPTTSLNSILVSFDQISSGTGPAQFSLLASSDGTNFSTVGGYTIPFDTFTQSTTNATTSSTTISGSSGFSSGASNSAFNFSFNLGALTALNNDPSAVFRLIDANTIALNGTASVAATGTDRVDNFVVSGSSAVPEPASLSLMSVAAAALLGRRSKAR